MPVNVFGPVYGTPFSQTYPFASGDTRIQYVGLYVQDRMQLTERLSLTAGGRFDFVSNRDFSQPNSNDNNAFSPRVGGTYRILPDVAVSPDSSKSFLPQTGMVYYGSSAGTFARPMTGAPMT